MYTRGRATFVAHWKHGNLSLNVWTCVRCPTTGTSTAPGRKAYMANYPSSLKISLISGVSPTACSSLVFKTKMHLRIICRYNWMFIQIHNTYTCAASPACISTPCMRVVYKLHYTLIRQSIYCIRTYYMQTMLQVLNFFCKSCNMADMVHCKMNLYWKWQNCNVKYTEVSGVWCFLHTFFSLDPCHSPVYGGNFISQKCYVLHCQRLLLL